MSNPALTKVQITAEFVLDDGDYKLPGTFGPVTLTARDWADFDLQAEIETGVRGQNTPSENGRGYE